MGCLLSPNNSLKPTLLRRATKFKHQVFMNLVEFILDPTDTYLMRQIQSCIVDDPAIPCTTCRETTLDINVIRSRLFPELAALRKYANALIHHLDHPKNRGIAQLNIQGVFDYCYHLFQENAELLFGRVPESSFPHTKCKECGAKDAGCQ